MIYLTETQRAALTRYARMRHASMAEVVREAIDRLLATERRPRRQPRFVASAAGPERAPVSERAEELLREYLRRNTPQ